MISALVDRTQGEFPILNHKTYLASHSLGALPATTPTVMQSYCQAWAEKGILAWEEDWWAEVEGFSAALERILDAPSQSIVACLNVTLGFAAVASALDYGERPRVVMSDLEFTTSVPFWKGQEAYGAELVVVPSQDGISAPAELLAEAVDERTALIVTSHAFFRSGALQDLAAVGKLARQWGARWLIDGYQSIGSVPLSVRQLEPDFVVGGCHKWLCGGPGGGFLYVSPDFSAVPRLTGWFGLAEPFAYHKSQSPHAGVRRFLNGTPNVPGLFAAREGLAWIEKLGVAKIREHSLQLTERIMDLALERGLRVKTPRQGRNGMVCLDFPGARETCEQLIERGIICDYRLDCGLRVSPHFYNDESDVLKFFEHL